MFVCDGNYGNLGQKFELNDCKNGAKQEIFMTISTSEKHGSVNYSTKKHRN